MAKPNILCDYRSRWFFKFEAGCHPVKSQFIDNQAITPIVTGEGKLFVPHATQYGFILDIDDTVLVSHSTNTGKKLRVMFTKKPRSRKTFADVVKFYKLLSLAHTNTDLLNSIQNKLIQTCQFKHTDEAILHAKAIGLIV